ncbi:hypothetical protein ACFJIW_09125 [Tahibacter sp. UC22_41]|uniref:hypothetical protein n=1 Tax=Tahibacter sp. UC22_41 TaxID=3350178 RepID=UPI0036D9D22C
MSNRPSRLLLAAAAADAFAALLHLACIVLGPPAYRWLGAGERMAQMAARGDAYPTLVTVVIAGVLLVWALYALSGAGLIRRLPLTRLVLALVAAVYLLRAGAAAVLQPYFPGNSATFWWVSSGVCLLFGLLHALGLRERWHVLRSKAAAR